MGRLCDRVALAAGPVPSCLNRPSVEGALWQATSDAFLLRVPRVGGYHARAGGGLTVDAETGAEPHLVARLAAMTPLAAWLYLHGCVALHAAAAVSATGAVLVTGASTAGKSTLVAALLQRGWGFLADDLALVTVADGGGAQVSVTGDRLWLPADAADRLGAGRPPAQGDSPAAVAVPVPMRALVALGTGSNAEIAGKRLHGGAAFEALMRACYNTQVADALLDRGVLFRWAAALGGAVPVWRLTRPRGCWSVPALADWVAGLP